MLSRDEQQEIEAELAHALPRQRAHAPTLMLDEDLHHDLDADKVATLLAGYK
jgi:hypothetical protein